MGEENPTPFFRNFCLIVGVNQCLFGMFPIALNIEYPDRR